jgi:hypothetical protein
MTHRWLAAVLTGAALITAPVALAQSGQRPADRRADRGPQETETVDRTVPFPARGTLRLQNFSGAVRITAGSGRDAVIKATRRATREELDHIKLTIETQGSTLAIEANDRDETWERQRSRWRDGDSGVVDTEFEIQLPADANLDIDVFSSRVDVRGITGEHDIETFSGLIVADLTASSASPRFRGETFSGDIRVRVASTLTPGVQFDSFSGDLRTAFPVTLNGSSRRGRRVTSGSTGDATLRFHTFSGNVEIER